MRKLYLDVDGVLLTARDTKAAPDGVRFLEAVLPRFDCYWLTTHCRDGNSATVLRRLADYYPQQTIDRLKAVKPVAWNTLKTEALDFDSDFYWMDDYAFEAEKWVLRQRGLLDRLIQVDLNRERELLRILSERLLR